METTRRRLLFDSLKSNCQSIGLQGSKNPGRCDKNQSRKRKASVVAPNQRNERENTKFQSVTEIECDTSYLSPEPSSHVRISGGPKHFSPRLKVPSRHPKIKEFHGISSLTNLTVFDFSDDDEEPPSTPIPRGSWMKSRVKQNSPLIQSKQRKMIQSQADNPLIFDLTDESTTPTLGSTEALHFLRRAYAEVEEDDRDIYKISDEVCRSEIAGCTLSELMEQANTSDLQRMTTYGEINIEDFSETIIPLLQLTESDVFYDLGCGTGKPVLQVALETTCRASKGMELFRNRVMTGKRALDRLEQLCPSVLDGKDIQVVQGDLVKPPSTANMLDATVVFINNVVFTDDLMHAVMDKLRLMKSLKRVVVSKKLCVRHIDKLCKRTNNCCTLFHHPPREATVNVTWTRDATVYVYQRIHRNK